MPFSRFPRCRRRCPASASTTSCARRCAGRAGGSCWGPAVVGAERDGERVTAVRAHASGHDTLFGARWFVLASGGVASGALELNSDWIARDTVLDLPLRGLPATGEDRFRPEYFADQPMAGVGIAVDGSLLCRGHGERVRRGGRRFRARTPGTEHLGDGHRAGERLRRGDPPSWSARGRGRPHDHHSPGRPARSRGPAQLARPLREVHDLRDGLPGLERHAAVRGAEVHRSAGRALPRDRPGIRGVVGGLLLRLRAVHPGLPPGREDRRAERARAPQAQAQEGRAAGATG